MRNSIDTGAVICSVFAAVALFGAGSLLALMGYLVLKGLWPPMRALAALIFAQSGDSLLSIWIRSLFLLLAATLLALPLAIGTGIYLSEYTRQNRARELILSNIAGLGEVPPVVYGLVSWGALAPYFGEDRQTLVIVLTASVWLLPQLIVAAYWALQEIPVSFRRDSLALGATRWQTIRWTLMPYSGRLLAAKTLEGMARVGGEAAPVIMVAAAWPDSSKQPLHILPYYLYRSLIEAVDPATTRHFGAALLLVLTSVCFQWAALRLRRTGVVAGDTLPGLRKR